MTRTRNILMNEFSPQIARLSNDSQLGMPLGIGTTAGASLHAIEELAVLAGRKANAKRIAALSAWAASPYYDLRQAAAQSKGVIGELLTKALFQAALGLSVEDAFKEHNGEKVPATKYDEMISGLGSNDSKLATLSNTGHFTWSAINPQDEKYVTLWGVEPAMIRGWLIPTEELTQLFDAKKAGMAIQGIGLGAAGFNINFKAERTPSWITPFGGDEASLRARTELEIGKNLSS